MFFLFPIRHDRMVVRRLPWVSIAFVAVNVLLFLVVTRPQRNAFEERFETALREVFTFRTTHPQVEPSPRLRTELPDLAKVLEPIGPGFQTRRDSQFLSEISSALTRPGGSLPTAEQLDRDQKEFTRLQDVLLDARDDDPFRRLGYLPDRPSAPKLLTSQFVHGGWLHLFFNMLFLYLAAPFIEDAWGRIAFPAFYLTGGAVAALSQAAQFPGSTTPLIGASGAIAAAMGAFLVRFGAAKIRFWYAFVWPFPFRVGFGTFPAPAWLVLPLWLVEQLWYAGLSTEKSGTAFTAHVGGFLFGAAVAVALRAAKFEARFVDPVVEAETTLRVDPRLENAIDLRTAGRFDEALPELLALVREEPGNVDAHGELFHLGVASGNPDVARRHGCRRIELLLRGGDAELALHAYDELEELFPDSGLSPRVRFAIAGLEEKAGQTGAAARTYRRVVEAAPEDPLAFRSHVRLASLALAEGRTADARSELDAAGAHPARRPENDAELARLLEQISRVGRPESPLPAAPPGRTPETPRRTLELSPPPEPAVLRRPTGSGATATAVLPPPAPVATAAFAPAPSQLRLVEAVPLALGANGIELDAAGRRLVVPWSRIDTIGVGLIAGSGAPETQVLLCCRAANGSFDVARLRSGTMRLPELSGKPALPRGEQFALLVGALLDRSRCAAFPDREHALGRPFAPFPTSARFEEAVGRFLAERTVPAR